MLARFRPSLRLFRQVAHRKCPRHRKSCVIVGRAASDSPSANSAGSVSHYELRFPVSKTDADAVSDELLETSAALSVTLEDANAGTDAEQEIFAGGGSRRRVRASLDTGSASRKSHTFRPKIEAAPPARRAHPPVVGRRSHRSHAVNRHRARGGAGQRPGAADQAQRC